MPRETWNVIWDMPDDPDGNVQHVAQHGLTMDKVEDVMLDASLPIEASASTGRPLRQGWTLTGRYIVVIWDTIDDNTVQPVTAFELDE